MYISSALTTPGAEVGFSDIANTGLYNRVKELIEKADTGYISSDDRQFLGNISYHIDRLRRENIGKKDEFNYLQRTSALLDRFDT